MIHPILKALIVVTVMSAVTQTLLADIDADMIQQVDQYLNSQIPQQRIHVNTNKQDPTSTPSCNKGRFIDDEPIPQTHQPEPSSTETASSENPEDIVSLDLKLKFPAILPPKTSISEQMLLTLTTQDKALASRTPMDLIWVVDTSGSMSGHKTTLLKDTLKYLLNLMTPSDRLSIVRFSSDAQRLTPLKPVTQDNEAYFNKVIDGLFAEGGTNIAAGIDIALRILRDRFYKDRVASIFVLSDGQDNDWNADHNIQQLLVKNNDVSGYTIHTFGYGADHDPKLMSNIAKRRDGNFYYIEKLETADESFADALGGIATVVAENVAVSIRPMDSPLFSHVSIERAFGGESLWRKTESGWYETNINQLSSGKKKNYVLTLNLGAYIKSDSGLRETKIAKAVVSYRMPGNDKTISKEIELSVKITEDENEFNQQQPDKQLLLNYYRVRAGEAMQESNKFAEEGNYETGKKTLVELREELQQSTIHDDEFIAATITDLESFAGKMEADTYHARGKFDLLQNIGAYMEEKSNPYLSNAYASHSNTMQSSMIREAKARKIEAQQPQN